MTLPSTSGGYVFFHYPTSYHQPFLCTICNVQEFRPAFAEASLLLREWKTAVLVAKIDGDSHKELAIKFQISTTPTTLLFENGEVQAEFSNEDPTAAGILSWVEKFLNGSSVELASMEQFSELEQDLQAAAVVAYFKNNSGGKEFAAFRKRKYFKVIQFNTYALLVLINIIYLMFIYLT